MFEQIVTEIKTKIEAITTIQDVYSFEVEQFKGDPAVVITPSSNEGDYDTTDENVRIYAFLIRVFVKRSSPRTAEDADRVMREIITDIIDVFDKDYTLSNLSNPTGYTFINTFATPSSWGYSGETDEYRVADINLRCRVSVDLSSI